MQTLHHALIVVHSAPGVAGLPMDPTLAPYHAPSQHELDPPNQTKRHHQQQRNQQQEQQLSAPAIASEFPQESAQHPSNNQGLSSMYHSCR